MAKGDDARVRNQVYGQQNRYESQQGPMVDAFGYNYGRGSETDYGAYNEIMQGYRNLLGGPEGGGGGGGGGGFSPSLIKYKDPFTSYGGYQEFSQTGGYSPENIADMRARGVAPTRAIYSNMLENMNRNRVLQGGYSPNYNAAAAKMARESSQAISDQNQNINADLAQMIAQGRLAGLGGMAGIEGQRLGADLDVAKFNAQAKMSAANSAAAGRQAGIGNQLAALAGMRSLYGTTPAQAELFGNQLLSGVGQGGQFGLGLIGQQNQGAQLPGKWEYTMDRIGDIGDMLYPHML